MKRTRQQNKMLKTMLNKLDHMLGENNSGLMIALLCDLLDKLVEGVDQREMRTIEVKLNDYFSVKYDFEKEKIIED